MRGFLPFFFLLAALAVLLRDDSVVTLLYLLVGVFVAGRWWSRRALRAVAFKRVYPDHVFIGETVAVEVRVSNAGWLPVVWLQLRESVSPDLAGRRALHEVLSLGPRGRAAITYDLQPHKRGYYPLGPLTASTGDVLGLAADDGQVNTPDYLTVYPQIIPLRRIGLPSRSPQGTLRDTQPIFADPARLAGRREYTPGDSLRRVDWKATAAVGRLQVKQFEPSIALATVLVLGFSHADYEIRTRYEASELAVVIAASIAHWVAGRRQAVGLLTNGLDPQAAPDAPPAALARKGRQSLMGVLELLARVTLAEAAPPVADLLRRASVRLPWGTTVVVVAGRVDEALLEALVPARRAGLEVVLILAGPVPRAADWRARAARLGVAVHAVARERDLDGWRR